MVCPIAYFISIAVCPNPITAHLAWAYDWIPGPEVQDRGISFTPDVPKASRVLVGIMFLPPGLLWLLLFVVPRSIAWVVAGFSRK